ncbi:hypothetical protein Desku_0916 [Desulfofundulus kuznetsovii DSM 6115]|uniref:Uncharacterized protein n=1 Tax=Desulfofundulus kuznetsovii (strain DSM 6115 / VKM B-1805 / 17) TaxID=760568 RepID=A0AAU8PNY8_DESK7|nr:hypothetical protein Desku_0916 [Desulfofundulus kuznetsovii DSM 6115]
MRHESGIFHKVESRSIEDVDSFVRIMNQMGVDPRPYIKADTTKVKKLLGDNPELLEKLGPAVRDNSYTRFESKKVKGDEVA